VAVITAGTLTRVYRTPEEALTESLANARRRLPIGCRVVHMDGTTGSLRDIVVDGLQVRLVIVTDDNRQISEMPGYWSRSSL
jgi:hypothetical protein